jgi:hypothetical protein
LILVLHLRLLTRFWPFGGVKDNPPRTTRSHTRHRAVVALMTGAVVTCAAQLGLAIAAESSLVVRDPIYADREAKLVGVERELPAGSPVVVMLGTSRTGNGFDAARASERLSRELGHPAAAFNFGVAASGPILHRVQLARLLAEGHRPTLLLVEVLPPSLADLKDGPLEAKFLDGSRFRREELDLFAAYGIPSAKVNAEWRGTLIVPWHALRFQLLGRLAPSALPFLRRCDESRTCDSHGWHRIWEEVLTPAGFEDGRRRARESYQDILRDFRPGGGAARALRDTLILAKQHGIPTRLVVMPESEWFRTFYSPAGLAQFDEWIGRLAQEQGCPLTDARQWIPDSGFADGHHLLPGAAAKFSDRLVDEVIVPALATGGKK